MWRNDFWVADSLYNVLKVCVYLKARHDNVGLLVALLFKMNNMATLNCDDLTKSGFWS